MKNSPKQILSLKNVTDQNLKIQNAYEGHVSIDGLICQVFLDPNNFLSFCTELSLNGYRISDGKFWNQLFQIQSSVPYPAKFILKEDPSKIYIKAEMPITGEESLTTGYSVLKEGIFFGVDLINQISHNTSGLAISKGKKTIKKSISTKEVVKIIEQLLNSNYVCTKKENKWVVSLNTDLFFQRIFIYLEKKVLKVTTHFMRISDQHELNQLATSLFLLQSTARIRFVRGIMISNDSNKTVGLEIVIPFILMKSYDLKKATESMILGIGYLQQSCDSLLNKTVAEAYLQNIWGISAVKF